MQLTAVGGGKFPLWILFLVAAILFFSAHAAAQDVSLSLRKAPLEKAIKQLERQTHLRFAYTREQLNASLPVTVEAKKEPLAQVLQRVFEGQPLTYVMDDKYIILKNKPPVEVAVQPFTVSGTVRSENGEALEGVSVAVKGSTKLTVTNGRGVYYLVDVDENAVLVFSSVGYESREVPIKGRQQVNVQLAVAIAELDETVVRAYGTTTKRLNTGNITKITSEEIEKQPVSNPLAALSGRVPGMVITQTSGVPGSAFKVEIRGRTSLDLSLSGNDPLFVIDGVPFEPGNSVTSQHTSAANIPTQTEKGGLSPLNSINPADIESIEVLKDADATAIYGSRGANGVVLITTKKGKPGRMKVSANVYTGWSRVTRMMKMMNTPEYVAMRKEAFANDGVVPTVSNAPDIMLWDTTRYTNFGKLLIGGTARSTQAQASISGGSEHTQFLLSNTYRRETTVYPGDYANQVTSVHLNLNHQTPDGKFSFVMSSIYSHDKNELPSSDLTTYIRQAPNLLLRDSTGNLSWDEKGVNYAMFNGYTNPLGLLENQYRSENDNLVSNLQLQYKITEHLTAKGSFGYNNLRTDERSIKPSTAINPIFGGALLPSSIFGSSEWKSWIIEPQVEYNRQIRGSTIDVLVGSTWQDRQLSRTNLQGMKYNSDLLLYSAAAAGELKVTNSYSDYRYMAVFGRANYTLNKKYILNFSLRRDGSSRFGPEKRFASFSALGAGWIFSEEGFMKKTMPFFSFGKLRASYGVTGNDQIGDYAYLDLWRSSTTTYQGAPGVYPSRLFNPDYNWERNRKMEAAVELGFLHNKLLANVSYYRHRSSNQLVSYRLPIQTGFSSAIRNFPALVENSGLEIQLSGSTNRSKEVWWQSSFNITVPRNKLVSFPGLASSSYANSYVEGEPLSVIRKYKYLGVDPETGVYRYEDLNKDGIYTTTGDYQVLGNTDPKFYAGLSNAVHYKGLELSVFVQGVKQTGSNYLAVTYGTPPGMGYNQPLFVQDRWQSPGDETPVARYTQSIGSAAGKSSGMLNQSNGVFSDASFIRLKNVNLTYQFGSEVVRRMHLTGAQVYVQMQNVLTFTNFKGTDPENQNYYQLPPLRSIVAGIQINF